MTGVKLAQSLVLLEKKPNSLHQVSITAYRSPLDDVCPTDPVPSSSVATNPTTAFENHLLGQTRALLVGVLWGAPFRHTTTTNKARVTTRTSLLHCIHPLI